MESDVPLVVPEINPQDAVKHRGIIANPKLHRSHYAHGALPIAQGVSGEASDCCELPGLFPAAGRPGQSLELDAQSRAHASGEEV